MPNLLESIEIPVRFTRRPISIAADYRPAWKISLLCLLLHVSSRAGRSSLKRLHVLNWAVRTRRHQEEFLSSLADEEESLFGLRIRFEPAFARALDFSAAEGLISIIDGDRAQLTEAGATFALALLTEPDMMEPELAFLRKIGKRLTEPQAMRLIYGPGAA